MCEFIEDENLSHAWARAVGPILVRGGPKEIAPLCVSITGFCNGHCVIGCNRLYSGAANRHFFAPNEVGEHAIPGVLEHLPVDPPAARKRSPHEQGILFRVRGANEIAHCRVVDHGAQAFEIRSDLRRRVILDAVSTESDVCGHLASSSHPAVPPRPSLDRLAALHRAGPLSAS